MKKKCYKNREWNKPTGLVSSMLLFEHVAPSCAAAWDTQVGGDVGLDMQQALADGKLQEEGKQWAKAIETKQLGNDKTALKLERAMLLNIRPAQPTLKEFTWRIQKRKAKGKLQKVRVTLK